MDKYIQRYIKFNKSMKIDEDILLEIDKLYKEFQMKPQYAITTKEYIHYEFEDVNELLNYKFGDIISTLIIDSRNNIKMHLKFEFAIEDAFIFIYSDILNVYYYTDNENKDILLQQKISRIYRNSRNNNWIIGKFGFLFYSFIIISIYDFIIFLLNGDNISFNMNNFWNWYIPTALPTALLLFILRKLDIFICQKLFNPLIYDIGKQKKKFNRISTIKSNIFWGVFVAIIVGIITTIICNNILK